MSGHDSPGRRRSSVACGSSGTTDPSPTVSSFRSPTVPPTQSSSLGSNPAPSPSISPDSYGVLVRQIFDDVAELNRERPIPSRGNRAQAAASNSYRQVKRG